MSERPRSPRALVVLALLAEAPMHPYRMRPLIKERGNDKIVKRRSAEQRLPGDRGLTASRADPRAGDLP